MKKAAVPFDDSCNLMLEGDLIRRHTRQSESFSLAPRADVILYWQFGHINQLPSLCSTLLRFHLGLFPAFISFAFLRGIYKNGQCNSINLSTRVRSYPEQPYITQ